MAKPPPLAQRNFEALCVLASREGWCWRIPCTTCGNQDFRIALRELAEGRLSEGWWSLAKNRRVLQQRLQHLHAMQAWPLEVQTMIVGRIADARLEDIARDGRFPDWLGLLGVVLQLTEDAEARDLSLTRSWGRKLSAMVPADRRATLPGGILADSQSLLTWRDLEQMEHALQDLVPSVYRA